MTTLPVQPPRTRRPEPDDSLNVWFIRLPILFAVGGVLLVLALMAIVLGWRGSYEGRILPGVSALGVSLGGMTEAQAQAALASRFSFPQSAVFTFRDGRDYWQFTAEELGVRYDPTETVAQALALGRGGDLIAETVEQTLIWLNGRALEPVVTYDQSAAVERLNAIAEQINQPAVEGMLAINGTEIVAVAGQVGRTLDVPATLAQLNSRLMTLTGGAEIALVIDETAPAAYGVELAEAKARAALSAPLTLTTDDGQGNPLGPWTISVDQIAQLLEVIVVENPDGTRVYDVGIDFSAFEDYLNTLAPGLATSPQDGRFRFNSATRELEIIQPPVGGRTLDVPATLRQLEQKAFSITDRTAPMSYTYIAPRYHERVTAAELGITELISESTTYFRGSGQNRRTNIAISAARFNGVIIPPGEEFSFNRLLGEITREAGYLDDNLIFGGRTIQGIGGGVCQTSTTAFRAAFYGGYTIIERNSHGYRVGYYEQNGQPPGLDAAIWQPERDFRFQNDTPYHLLIEVSIFPSDDALQFRFYSTHTGRIVEVETPRVANIVPALPDRFEVNRDLRPGEIVQVDYSADGADVNVTRRITYPDGTVRTDNIFTHYLPWGAIYQVAPGDPRLGSS